MQTIPIASTRLRPVGCACALLCASMVGNVLAQAYQPVNPTGVNSSNTMAPAVSGKVGEVDYGVNANIAKVVVEVEKDGLAADGQSTNTITVKLFDKMGAPITGTALITIEHSAGRVLLPGAKTDELGPGKLEVDKVTPGVQLKVDNGSGSFQLLAPTEPTDVKLRITAGSAVAQGTVSYLPELRDMVAAGLIEGIINWKKRSSSEIVPTRIDDGFERELRRWTREFNNGKGNYGARTAFFLKGQIKGDVLLTAAYDSDKDTNERLLRDIDPNRFYPVYGDSSITGFDAKSRDRLYVRVDAGKSYALYGDFSTGDGFSQLSGGGTVASTKSRNLGAYNRSATGLRGHYEQPNYFVNGFALRDNLKQLVEEYRANGTSGPFSVTSNAGIDGSEKVEIITRDKNALDRVVNVTLQQRLVDYSFEPFSGRILFKSPISSLDINGNPQSIRITYEVEQGGPSFTTYGFDGQVKLGERFEVGGSFAKDENPLSPYRLGSVNITARLNENSSVVFEAANSRATRYANGLGLTSTPSGIAGETREDLSGSAYRLEGNYTQGNFDGKFWWLRADKEFYNPAASVSDGRTEAGASAKLKLGDAFSIYGGGQKTVDGAQVNEPSRENAALGLIWNPNDRLALDASLRRSREEAGFTASAGIASNSIQGGGFLGGGSDLVNPSTNTSVLGLSPGNTAATGLDNPSFASATSVRLGLSWRATDRWTVGGDVEGGNDRQSRWGLSSSYQINERSRAYGRFERTTGLTSSNSLNPSDRSTSFIAGVDNTFASGASIFSEYRLRDALGSSFAQSRDQQLATGVRNTWNLREGLAVTGGVEYLKIFSGSTRDAFAISGGVDYSASELWKASARLEYRRLFDDKATPAEDRQDQYLSTISVARKIDRDWTLLARNYLLYQDNQAGGSKLEDRFQVGAAWRPVDHNRWNSLARYEFKTVRDKTVVPVGTPSGENYRAHIVSLHGDYHPSRPWWLNGRFAAKRSTDETLPLGEQAYSAYLVGGRLTYDITENWDIGLMTSYMWSPKGSAKQWAQGAELGYLLQQNLWLSAGFNWAGFSDRDLTGSDYTNRGFYIRLRFKFDENLFKGRDKDANRALDR